MVDKNLCERVAYLKGLTEGLGLDQAGKEGRILGQVIDVMVDVARAVTSIEEKQVDIESRLDALDEDLAAVEDDLYDEDYDYVEIECPHCKETICFDEDLLDEESELCCPNCGGVIFSAEREDGDPGERGKDN
ncbi:MAG: phage terminase large subunit family protein [Firmicutes bacterium]|nr:phage terminase large subunit family protein [Bacillota bacterium]